MSQDPSQAIGDLSRGIGKAVSGALNILTPGYETRKIRIAQGVQAHDADRPDKWVIFPFLEKKLGGEFTKLSSTKAKYTNHRQKVRFELELVTTKKDFKDALQTAGLHVVYIGHSRYGRGACFDDYSAGYAKVGEHWENGIDDDDGIYRLGFPYVPVDIHDMEKHGYKCAPVPVEWPKPAVSSRHPHQLHPGARRKLHALELPEALRSQVEVSFRSPTNRYFGFRSAGETNILLHAGWHATRGAPFDLGATDLKCKVFCHFGCSSKLHFWRIVRRTEYKGWERSKPPTDRYAYFTTSPSDDRATLYWLYHVLKYPKENAFKRWWESLEWARTKTSRKLRAVGAKCTIW